MTPGRDARSSPTGTARFSVGDAVLAWVAGVAASVAVGAFGGFEPSPLYVFGVILPTQSLVTLGVAWWIAARKGTGGPAAELGLRFRVEDAWALLLGGVLQLGIAFLLAPVARALGIEEPPQALARMIGEATTPAVMATVVVGVAVVGPLAEEVLFRGLLLKALLRRLGRWGAVAIQGVAFGLVHLLDPGAAVAVPVFVFLGAVLGTLAVRDGRLGRAFFTHAGINLTAALAAFLAG